MQVIHDPAEFQKLTLSWRKNGGDSALVPTMGALHEGHLKLIDTARSLTGKVTVSIFVNPTQFGPNEDFGKYPRTLEADLEACRAHGAAAVLAPPPGAVYPPGFQTRVEVTEMTKPLCGVGRPGHFAGVTQVVLKLFMLAQPRWGIFGWKDAQQLLVIRRMVRDLCVPVEVMGVETIREADGLAMSSRNRFLDADQRAAAPSIYAGLSAARAAFEAGENDTAKLVAIAREMIGKQPSLDIEYLEVRSMDLLETLERAAPGNTLMAAAVRCGATRLIDNVRF